MALLKCATASGMRHARAADSPRPFRGHVHNGSGESNNPNWEQHDIGSFANSVEEALRRQGKQARSADARDSAYQRVEVAVNELGPHLFPLIAAAERRVVGTRPVPTGNIPLRCDNYEVHGIVDVLTHMTLTQGADNNLIREHVHRVCPGLSGIFEVIVDYKGTRRPLTNEPYLGSGRVADPDICLAKAKTARCPLSRGWNPDLHQRANARRGGDDSIAEGFATRHYGRRSGA